MFDIKTTAELKKLAEEYSNLCPYLHHSYKDFSKFEIAQYISNWRVIEPEKSNYINKEQFHNIEDLIVIITEEELRKLNESHDKHFVYAMIQQGPDYRHMKGPRFIQWLKKKLLPPPLERIRIVLDDKYFTDVDITAVANAPLQRLPDILKPRVLSLIEALKEPKLDWTKELELTE